MKIYRIFTVRQWLGLWIVGMIGGLFSGLIEGPTLGVFKIHWFPFAGLLVALNIFSVKREKKPE